MSQVRVAVIAVGNNGGAYAKIYAEHDLADLVVLCDTQRDRAEKMAEELGVKVCAQDYREVVGRPDIDAVSIHAPDRLHAPMAIAALEAGKHVYIEKPMGTTIPDCHRVIELVDETGLKAMVGQVLRFNPLYSGIKEMVEAGELGDIFYAEGDYIYGGSASQSSLLRIVGTSECAFVCSGTHPFDLLRWYLGEPAEVQAYGNRGLAYPDIPKDDLVCAIYKFRSGCVVKVAAVWGASVHTAGHEFRYNLCLYGTKATILRDKIAYRGKPLVDLPFKGIEGHPYDPEADAFLRAIVNDEEPPVTARDGGNTAIGILAAVEALERGAPVKVPVC